MNYDRGRRALGQESPSRAQRGSPATEWGDGGPASGRRGFGAQPQVNEAAQPQAGERFETCRWHANPDNGGAPYCAHRDVLPYAGMNGFNPEAWCPDCRFFKMRRGARKQTRYLTDDF